MPVPSSVRQRGIGRQIVNELLATASKWGIESVVLETTSSWDDVISFYQHCGFRITHVEDGDFGSDTWFELRLSQ